MPTLPPPSHPLLQIGSALAPRTTRPGYGDMVWCWMFPHGQSIRNSIPIVITHLVEHKASQVKISTIAQLMYPHYRLLSLC
jgi:hypothetical protein